LLNRGSDHATGTATFAEDKKSMLQSGSQYDVQAKKHASLNLKRSDCFRRNREKVDEMRGNPGCLISISEVFANKSERMCFLINDSICGDA
jgi:hypothetical protein